MPQLSYARPAQLYAGAPVDESKDLNESVANQYDTNVADKTALDVMYNNLDVEQRNLPIKQRAIGDLKKRLQDTVDQGNYEDASYAIQDAKKAYMTDNELQGAIKSRQAEAAYQQQLKDRLDKGLKGEKGGITEKQYNYALSRSRDNNKAPIQYDPQTGLIKNNFSGVNVSDDLSSEIQDDLMNVTKDWKANGTFTIDGNQYTRKVDNLTGVEKVMRNGKEVPYSEVANAMKQYVMNKEPYRAYLDESRNIDKYNRTAGGTRELDRTDLGAYTDQELRDLYRGANDSKIAELSKDKSTRGQAILKQIQDRDKNFDPHDPEVINQLYDHLEAKDQLNNVVYPSAEKASFQDFEDKIFTDNAALEAIKHQNDLDLENHKKKLAASNMAPIVPGVSKVNLFTGQDFLEKKKNLDSLGTQIQQAQLLMKQAEAAMNANKSPTTTSLYRTRVDNYNALLGEKNIAESDVKNFYSNIPEEYKDKIKKKIGYLFNNHTTFSAYGKPGDNKDLDELIKQAKVNNDSRTMLDLMTVREAINKEHDIDPALITRLENSLVNNKDYLNLTSNLFNAAKAHPYMDGSMIEKINKKYNEYNTIDDLVTSAYNDEALSKDGALKLYTIPSISVKENPELANQYNAVTRSIMGNSMNIRDNHNIPLDKIIGGTTSEKFWVRNDKGDYVMSTPDTDQTQMAVAAGSPDGRKRVSATFYNKAGVPLVLSESKPNDKSPGRGAVYLSSEDPNTFNGLFGIVQHYAAQTGDTDTANKIAGELGYGSILNKARLGADTGPFEVTSPSGNSRIVEFKAVDGKTSIVYDMTPKVNGKDNPNYGKPLFDGIGRTSAFSSNEQLLKTFAELMP